MPIPKHLESAMAELRELNQGTAAALEATYERKELDDDQLKVVLATIRMTAAQDIVNNKIDPDTWITYSCVCGAICPTEAILEAHIEEYCKEGKRVEAELLSSVTGANAAFNFIREELPNGLFMANKDPNLILDVRTWEDMAVAYKMGFNICLRGETGLAKTAAAVEFGACMERPLALIECGRYETPKEFFGHKELVHVEGNGTITQWKKGILANACAIPNAVVILDELTRVENTKVANGLMGLLGFQRSTFLDDIGEWLNVAPGVTFIATMNEGLEYTGTDVADIALMRRFKDVWVQRPSNETMAQIMMRKAALELAKCRQILKAVEGYQVSPAVLIEVAQQVKFGRRMDDSIRFACGSMLDKGRLGNLLQQVQKITAEPSRSTQEIPCPIKPESTNHTEIADRGDEPVDLTGEAVVAGSYSNN